MMESVQDEKDIGFYFSKDFTVAKQYSETCQKATKVVCLIAKKFEYKTKDIIIPLFNHLFDPISSIRTVQSTYMLKDIEKLESSAQNYKKQYHG